MRIQSLLEAGTWRRLLPVALTVCAVAMFAYLPGCAVDGDGDGDGRGLGRLGDACDDDNPCGEGLECGPESAECEAVVDLCEGVECPDGETCNAATGECEGPPVDPCEGVECPEGETCNDETGECEGPVDLCEGVECPEGETCNDETGECEEPVDLCEGVECPEGETCNDETGECEGPVDLCEGVECPDGETCNDETGECAPTVECGTDGADCGGADDPDCCEGLECGTDGLCAVAPPPGPGDLEADNPDVNFDELTAGSDTALAAPTPGIPADHLTTDGCTCVWGADGGGTFGDDPDFPGDSCHVTYTPAVDDTSITVTVTCGDVDTTFDQAVDVACDDNADCGDGFECDTDTGDCVEVVEETFTLTADASATQDEGDTGTTDFTFTLSRSGGDGAAKTLDWAVSSAGGTGAAANDDFVDGAFPTGTVDFAEDDFDDKTITVEVLGDANVEDDEVFTLTVTDAGTEVAAADGTILTDDSSADPVVTLPSGAGATVGQNSLITGISVSDADNGTSTVKITTGDGLLSFSAAPAATAVDGAGNAVTAANVLHDEYTLTGTITNINTTLAGFQFLTDRVDINPGTDQVAFLATDADGGSGSGTLDVAVGKRLTLTGGNDTGASFVGTTGNDVFLDAGPGNFGQGDVFDGGAGYNIVEIQTPVAATYPAADVAAFSAKNIQEIWLNQTGAGGAPTLDNFVDMPSLNTIRYSPGAANNLTINDAPNAFTLIVDTRNAAFAAQLDVDIVNPVFGTQSFTLEMQGSAGTPLVIGAIVSGTEGIETLNINSVSQNGTTAVNTITGASTINITTLNITGDQDLVAGAWTGANTTVINAEGFDGKLTVTSAINGATITGGNKDDTLNGGANSQQIAGGPGNDTINPGAVNDLVETGTGADTIVVVAGDVTAAGGAVVYDRWTDFTTGAGGDAMDYNTALNDAATGVGPPFTSVNYLSAAQSDTMITGAAANVVIFEFTGATLANDIVPGTTTAGTVEGWAATALATVDHGAATDFYLFIMYDTGTGANLDAAVFLFDGDATATGIVAAELQLIAVIEGVVLDSVTAENFK